MWHNKLIKPKNNLFLLHGRYHSCNTYVCQLTYWNVSWTSQTLYIYVSFNMVECFSQIFVANAKINATKTIRWNIKYFYA